MYYRYKKPLLLIIDGNHLAYRQFYSPGVRHLSTKAGKPSGLFYGFLRAIQDMAGRFHPKNVVVTFDGGYSGRERIVPEYKAHRNKTDHPDHWFSQLTDLQTFIRYSGMKLLHDPDVEADDFMSLCAYAWYTQNPGGGVVIATSDSDLFQCVNARIIVFDSKSSNLYDEKTVKAKIGVAAQDVAIYKAIVGDKTDNIAGLEDWKPKAAKQLLTSETETDKQAVSAFFSRSSFMNNYNIIKLPSTLKEVEFLDIRAKMKKALKSKHPISKTPCIQLLWDYECYTLLKFYSGFIQEV